MSIIIIGGGMTGTTLALALSTMTQNQVRIHLVESVDPQRNAHPGFDQRWIALSYGSVNALQRIDVWPALTAQATTIESIHVSDKGHFGHILLQANEHHLPYFGQVVSLRSVGTQLFSQLRQYSSVKLHCPAKMIAVQRHEQHVTVTLDNGEILNGQLVVAADGSHSSLASYAGLHQHSHDYQQVAVIANVVMSHPIAGRAFERFTAYGPLAMLPTGDNCYSLVWCHANYRQNEVNQYNDQQFKQALQYALGWRLGQVVEISQRQTYPVSLQIADEIFSHRLVLVGNAAQTLHPVAGQGFNLALRDVMRLAEHLTKAYGSNKNLGDWGVLRQYSEQRQADRQRAIQFTDTLLHLFANDIPLLAMSRDLGLSLMDKCPLLRNLLVKQASGIV